MSEANRVSLKYIAETVYGTTPVSGNWNVLRYTSQNMAANPQTVISNELRSDRQVSDLILVGNQVGGEFGLELSAGTYDELLEAAMQGTWATNILKVGQTARSFSFEAGVPDWTTPHFFTYKGMRVAGFNMNFPYGAVVTGGFKLVGKEATESITSLNVGTDVAANTNPVMNGSSGISSILLDGGAPGVIIKSVSLNVDNSMRPIEGIGTLGPSNQASGRAMITGTVEAYFDNITLYRKLLQNALASLAWTVGDGSKTYAFSIAKLKFNDGNPAVSGVDTDTMLSLNFTALYDATDTALKITRVP